MLHCTHYNSIEKIPAAQWDGLFDSHNPFAKHAFLLAMEESGCVSSNTGWQPHHLMIFDDGKAVAAMPLYAKNHSYGEFVFDWGWADAYARHGLNYYPKLITAIPFSPVTGPRIGIADGADSGKVFSSILDTVHSLTDSNGYSGWHLLFPDLKLQHTLVKLDKRKSMLGREAVQFHWFNRDYRSFDDFLASLRSSRRKTMKRERRKVAEQDVSLERKTGDEITDEEWQGFYQCYINTYRKRSGHDGYLNAAFFDQLRETMPEQLMLVVARREGGIVAASLFLHDETRLYGRYWGALEDISCLHFETCFYQGIEFCIENSLQEFDPGTQGEHKLMRGFEPVKSFSLHWIADPRFRAAIADFLHLERRETDRYQKQAEIFLPYRKDGVRDNYQS